MSINTCRVLIAAFLLSSFIAINNVSSTSVIDNNLLLPVSSFSHFCNNGYASLQTKLDTLKSIHSTPNRHSTSTPEQQYELTRRQIEEEGRIERALKTWPLGQHGLETKSTYESAVKKFKAIALLVPTIKESHCKLGLAYFVNGDYFNAKQSILKGLKIDSGDIDLNILMGQILLLEHSNIKSCSHFDKVLKLEGTDNINNNNRIEAHLGKAVCSANSGLSNDAIQQFKHVVANIAPLDNKNSYKGDNSNINVLLKVSAYVGIGRVLCTNENWEQATGYFNQALQLMPQSSKVQMAIGDCYYSHASILAQYSQQDDAGEGDRLKTKAISHYQQATWLNKNSVESNLKLGNILIHEKRYKEAFSHLQKAVKISLNNNDIASYNQGIRLLAGIFSLQNNLKAAEAYYQKVLTSLLDNDDSNISSNNKKKRENEIMDIKMNLVTIKAKRGNFVSASNLMREVVKVNKLNAKAHAKLAKLLFFSGDNEGAIESARHSVWLDDRCVECRSMLSLIELYTSDSSFGSVINNLSVESLDNNDDTNIFLNIKNHLIKGVAYAKMNNWEQAAYSFQSCIKYGGDDVSAATSNENDANEGDALSIINTNTFLQSLCLSNLAVMQIYVPGAESEITIQNAKANFKRSHDLIPSKCKSLKNAIFRHYSSLTSNSDEVDHALSKAIEDSQQLVVDRALVQWLCSQTKFDSKSTSLLLPLKLGKINTAILNNVKGVAITKDKSKQENSNSWVGWMKGVVTSFVGEKKLSKTNTTKTRKSKNTNDILNVPDISSMMAPPMVTPGSVPKHINIGISSTVDTNDGVTTSEGKKRLNENEKTNAELMGEYRSHVTNGQIFENAGEWKSAVLSFEKAILLIKNHNNFHELSPELLHSYGRTLHLTGDRRSAIEAFDQAIYLLDSNNNEKNINHYGPKQSASLLADAGMAHDEENNIQRAANLYVAAIDTDPTSYDAYHRLARLLIKDGQSNVAISFYYRLLKVQLKDGVENATPRPFKSLITLLFDTSRYEETIIMFKALLDIGAKPGMELVRKYIISLQALQHHDTAIEYIRRDMSHAKPSQRDRYFDLLSSSIKEKAALDEARVQLESALTISNTGKVNLDILEAAITIAPEMQMQTILIEAGKILIENANHSEKYKKLGEEYLREAINISTTNTVGTVKGVVELSNFIEQQGLFQLNLTKLEELLRFSEFILDNVPSMGFYGDLPPPMTLKVTSKLNIGEKLLSILQNRNYVRKGAWQRIIRILAYVGNWEEAERQCTKWLSELPDDVSALSALSEIHLQGFNNLERAIELMNKAINHYEIKRGNQGASNRESNLVFNVDADGTSIIRLMHKVGFKALVNKNYNQSKDIFTSSYNMAGRPEISDNNLKILSSELLAKTDFAAGDVEKARSRLLQLQKEGLTWGGYRLLGDIYKEDGDQRNVSAYKNAISNYQTAIKLSNGTLTDADLHYNLGSSLLNDGQYDQAAESLRTAMSLQPNNSHVLNNLGVAYFHLNRRAEAQKLIERSVKLDDGCMSRFNLGTFLYESQQYYSAIKHFRHALRLCRESKQNGEEAAVNELDVQINLAKSLRRDPKKTHESLALYRAVLKEMKSEKVRIEQKDNNKVMLAAHDMQVGNILTEIGDILVSLDRYVEAIDVIYESMEIRNKNGDNATRLKSRIDYGNSLLYAGRLKEAKDQYEIVLKAAPTYVTAFNNLGVVAFRSKKFKEARMWFQKVLRHDSRHVEAKLALEQLPSRVQNFHVPILDDGVNSLVHKIVRDSP